MTSDPNTRWHTGSLDAGCVRCSPFGGRHSLDVWDCGSSGLGSLVDLAMVVRKALKRKNPGIR